MELKIKDLRIGSLFHIEVRNHYRMVSIGVINRNRIVCDILPNYVATKVDLYKLKPITLNKKEMMSLGFKIDDSGKWWKHVQLDGGISVATLTFQYQRRLRFKYVHELQTFMFAMTGEDVVYEYRSK